MTHDEKIQHLLAELERLGKPKTLGAPPVWRLLWSLGWKLPPPMFLGFWPLALSFTLILGMFWGVFMWVLQWGHSGLHPLVAVGASAVFGLIVGPTLSWFVRRERLKLRLPSWEEYPTPGQATDAGEGPFPLS